MLIEENEFAQVDYNDVRTHFGDDTIKDRYSFLYEKMNEYISERYSDGHLYINEDILQQAVMDYFVDIYRLKKFHRIERVNITKIVAYEVYWLWRRKPIQLSKASGNVTKDVFANEGFLTVFIAHECLGKDSLVPLNDDQENAYLNFLRHINYCLKYRNVEKQALESILMAFGTGHELNG